MSRYLKAHFDTEGPFGLPMKDAQARALEERLKALPSDGAYALRRCAFERGVFDLQPGERADVSWITEESPDRLGDVVLASGMDDSHYQLNPIVTLNHAYDQPPVGRSLWRLKASDGKLRGVKAKTQYPARPMGWSMNDWPPDLAFELVQAGLLRGKSIGFIPLKLRSPSQEDIQQNAHLANVRYIIEEWLLAEYACCYLPMQPNAVVEMVSKSLPADWVKLLGLPQPRSVAFTSLDALASAARRLVTAEVVEKACERAWRKARGLVE